MESEELACVLGVEVGDEALTGIGSTKGLETTTGRMEEVEEWKRWKDVCRSLFLQLHWAWNRFAVCFVYGDVSFVEDCVVGC